MTMPSDGHDTPARSHPPAGAVATLVRAAANLFVAGLAMVALAVPVAAHGSDPRPLRLERTAAALVVAVTVAVPAARLLADREDRGAVAFVRLAGALAVLSLGATYVVPAVGSPGPLLVLAGTGAAGAAVLVAVAPRLPGGPERRVVEGVALGAAGQATLPLALFAGAAVGLGVGTGRDAAWWRRQALALVLLALAAVPTAVALAVAPHAAVDTAFAAAGGALGVFGAAGVRRRL